MNVTVVSYTDERSVRRHIACAVTTASLYKPERYIQHVDTLLIVDKPH
jgi:hypothetical protein